MASAASLNALATIVSGHGLSANVDVITEITTFQNNDTLALVSNIYATASTYSNVADQAIPELNKLAGSTVTISQWLLDAYPYGSTVSYSGGITAWAANTVIAVGSLMSYDSHIYNVTGNVFSESFDANVTSNSEMVGFSEIVKRQSQLPFANGLAGFANVFMVTQGYASSVLDTVGSLTMLKGKTYGQSGVGYTGAVDLVTGGVGNHAPLLGNTISNWGTMYDITKINLISDPYVFGQNLLNQNLGSYGNLSDKLAATGLDVTDITAVPAEKTTTTQEGSSITSSSFIGEIELPIVSNVTTTTTVTGNSPNVVKEIYKTITGANLQAIVSATGFSTTSTQPKTLADYLDLIQIVDPELVPQLAAVGITDFATFSKYLNNRVGQGYFKSWKKLSEFLNSIEIPKITHTTTSAAGNVLLANTESILNSVTSRGSGDLGQPVMLDFFGAAAGKPYIDIFKTLNKNYNTLIPPVYTKLQALEAAVIACNNYYVSTGTPESSPGAGDGTDGTVDVSGIITAVTNVNTSLNAINNATAQTCQTQYLRAITSMATEVTNLHTASATFGSANDKMKYNLGQQIANLGATDNTGLGTDVVINAMITNDFEGDLIRLAISEHNNAGTLGGGGVVLNNDPNPRQAIANAKAQNIPLSTYISQNK